LKKVPDIEELYKKCCGEYKRSEEIVTEFPEMFSRLYEKVAEKESFDNFVFRSIIPTDTSHSSTHNEIALAFDCFVSINYYDPIEDAFKQNQKIADATPKDLATFYFSFPEKEKAKYSLTYLHGGLKMGFCILRKKDYQYFYPSLYERNDGVYAIENSLKKIMTEWQVVFWGCSIESHLRRFIQYLKSNVELESKVNNHYLIMSDSGILKYLKDIRAELRTQYEKKYFSEFNQMNMKPIIYSGDHIFNQILCDTLSSVKKKARFGGVTFDPLQK
jgi:hypothetical protein